MKFRWVAIITWTVISLSVTAKSQTPQQSREKAAADSIPQNNTALVPTEPILGFVFRPRQILTSPQMAKFDYRKTFPRTSAILDLREVEMMVKVTVEPAVSRHSGKLFDEGTIIRFDKTVDVKGFASVAIGVRVDAWKQRHPSKEFISKEITEDTIDGKSYFYRDADKDKLSTTGISYQIGPYVHQVDKQTLLICEEEADIRLMMTSAHLTSPLKDQLAKVDSKIDFACIFTNRDDLRRYFREGHRTGESDVMRILARFPASVEVATLTMHNDPDVVINLSLEVKDATSVKEVESFIEDNRKLLKEALNTLTTQTKDIPDENRRSLMETALKVGNQIAASLQPKIVENRLEIEIRGLGKIEALAELLNLLPPQWK